MYNTFPFPSVNDEQKKQIEHLAKNILRARMLNTGMTLAELYNPETMPDNLKTAHSELDMAVDKLYREQGFADTAERLAFLLNRYEMLVAKEQAGKKAKK
ncbi:type IIL restriction-modification enzyme MmeI [Moraxella sp. ZY210820]|uniref:type IIL restriction-modification enzyme MmeI n=1 Tax=Moraxella sp. ZY210820 TaxID=2904123 RepID=UPI00351E7ACD